MDVAYKVSAVLIVIASALNAAFVACVCDQLQGLQTWVRRWRDLVAEHLQEGDCSRAIGIKENDNDDKDNNTAYHFYGFIQLGEVIRECRKLAYIMLANAGIVFYLALQNLSVCWK